MRNKSLHKRKYKKIRKRLNEHYYSMHFDNTRKERSCLMCGKMFDSENRGNRRCPKCARLLSRHLNDEFYMPRVYKFIDVCKEYTYTIAM